MAVDGLITLTSRHGQGETADRLAAAVTARGAAVVARVDHAKAAASVGLSLSPTEVVIFGNPRAGMPAHAIRPDRGHRSAAEGAGVDGRGRRHAALVRRPERLARRHGADAGHEATLQAMRAFLAAVAAEAAG